MLSYFLDSYFCANKTKAPQSKASQLNASQDLFALISSHELFDNVGSMLRFEILITIRNCLTQMIYSMSHFKFTQIKLDSSVVKTLIVDN